VRKMKIRPSAIRFGCFASLLYLVLLLVPAGLYAECQVTLAWDANHPTPDGYRLFQRASGESYNYHIFTDVGLSTSHAVSGLSDNTTYHFVVRAYVGSQESGDSNEATYTCNGSAGGAGTTSSNPPLQPVAVTPADQTMDVSLRPTLTTSAFIDHDTGDYHAKTRWVIYRLDDDALVLDTTSSSALRRLKVPASTLSPFTTYYWSATNLDQNGDKSPPAQSCTFTTFQTPDEGTSNTTQSDAPAALSTDSNSGSGGGGSGGGGGCFIQSLLDKR